MPCNVHLTWHGPFSLVENEVVPYVFDDEIAKTQFGVYLWTIEYGGSHLINYVGKTDRTFATRFREEIKWERKTRGLCVDVELFLKGVRREVPWHFDRVEEVLRAYRVFVSPLPSLGDDALKGIEGSLIEGLYHGTHGQFLSNSRSSKHLDGVLTMDAANVRGLEAFVCAPAIREGITNSSDPAASQRVRVGDKALHEVRWFFSVPWSRHGKKQIVGQHKGWYQHDWGHLVQRVSVVDLGHEQPIALAWQIGNELRRRCRNKAAWDAIAIDQYAQQEMLTMLRTALRTAGSS